MRYKKMSVWKMLAITVLLCLFTVSMIHSENPWIIDQGRPGPVTPSGSCSPSAAISPNQPYTGLAWPYSLITQVSLAITNLVINQGVVSR